MRVLTVILAILATLGASFLGLIIISGAQSEKIAKKEAALEAATGMLLIGGSSWELYKVQNPLGMSNRVYSRLLDRLTDDLCGNTVPCLFEFETARESTLVYKRGSPRICLSPSYTKDELRGMLVEVAIFDSLWEKVKERYIIGYPDTLDLVAVNKVLLAILSGYGIEQEKLSRQIVLSNSWDMPSLYAVTALKIRVEAGGYAQPVEVPTIILNINADNQTIRDKLSALK